MIVHSKLTLDPTRFAELYSICKVEMEIINFKGVQCVPVT